jgi:hypothetical protein
MMVAAATGPMPATSKGTMRVWQGLHTGSSSMSPRAVRLLADTYQCHESKRLAETNMEDHPTELDHQWP